MKRKLINWSIALILVIILGVILVYRNKAPKADNPPKTPETSQKTSENAASTADNEDKIPASITLTEGESSQIVLSQQEYNLPKECFVVGVKDENNIYLQGAMSSGPAASNIYSYNIKTSEKKPFITAVHRNLSIICSAFYDKYAIWCEVTNNLEGKAVDKYEWYIYLKDIASGEVVKIDSRVTDITPDIKLDEVKNKIAFNIPFFRGGKGSKISYVTYSEDINNPMGEIKVYDMAAKKSTTIYSFQDVANIFCENAKVSGDFVTWTMGRPTAVGSSSYIYRYNLSTGQREQLSRDPLMVFPTLSANKVAALYRYPKEELFRGVVFYDEASKNWRTLKSSPREDNINANLFTSLTVYKNYALYSLSANNHPLCCVDLDTNKLYEIAPAKEYSEVAIDFLDKNYLVWEYKDSKHIHRYVITTLK